MTKRIFRVLFLASCLVTIVSLLHAQWVQTNGPYGVPLMSFAVSGTSLFAGTQGSGVFLSTNNGTSWTAVNTGLTNTDVRSLAASGMNLFAGTNAGGVFLSTDNGTSWTARGLTGHYVGAFAVSPNGTGGTNLFAGTDGGGVFLSSNNGASWTSVNTGLPNNTVAALAISSTNLFAGTIGGGVFLSTNNGTSWTAVNTGLFATRVNALAISGTNLFAATWASGVFLSTNNGTSWSQVNTGLTTTQGWPSLAVSGVNIFAGNDGGVFLSTNNGTSWTRVNSGLTSTFVYGLGVSGTNLFAGTLGGVFLSTNNGSSWTQASTGVMNTYSQQVLALAVSGTNSFAGTHNGGVFLSADNGTNWTAVNTGLTSSTVRALVVSGTNLFAGTDGDGIFLSTNDGTSWTQVLTNAVVQSLAASGTNLFAGTAYGVHLSTNNGTSWTRVSTGLTSTFVYALAVSGTNLFAGGDNGVFLSTDKGTSWMAVNTGLTNTTVYALAVSPASGGSGMNLFAGTDGGGVFLSTNNGSSWTQINTGLTSSQIYALIVSGTNLFAGANDGDVFLSTNNGTSWVSTGLNHIGVNALAVSGTNLFAGVYRGVWRRPLGDWMSLLVPTYGKGGITLPVTFKWNMNPLALSYAFQISTDAGFSNLVINQNTVDTSYAVSNLQVGAVYYWRVRAENQSWASDWGVSTFTTKLTASPQLVAPLSGATVNVTPMLQWNQLAASATYTVQVSTTTTFNELIFSKDTSSTSVLLPRLQYATSYYWRVHAQTPGDTSAWSGVSSFTTQLKGSILVYPDSGNQNAYSNDWLLWKADPLAASYHVEISQTPLFSQLHDSATVTGTGYRNSAKLFTSGSTYFWRVRGISSGVNGEFSNVWSFKAGTGLRTPAVSIRPKTIDFGLTKVGVNAQQSISVGNSGNDTLKVAGITVSSLNLKAVQGPSIVVPGGAGELILQFSPSSGGAFIGAVTVSTNAQSSPDTIHAIGFGLTSKLKTNTVIDFGRVKQGATKDTVLSLVNSGNDTLQIMDISIFGPAFSLRTFFPLALPGNSIVDTLRFVASNPGLSSGYVVIKSNASSSPDTTRLTGFGATYGLRLSTARLDIGSVLVGKYKDTTISITNLGNDTLRVSSISITVPGITASPIVLSLLPNGSAIDTIRFTPAYVGPVSGVVTIASNAPTSPDSIRITASGVTSTVGMVQDGVPSFFELKQNYPNPFNPSTTIRYSLPKAATVMLRIFNTLGQLVATLVDERREPGCYAVKWNADAPSGIYFYRLQAGEYLVTNRMILLK